MTDHEAALAAAREEGVEIGTQREHDRIFEIIECEEAKGRLPQALAIAKHTAIAPEHASELLMTSPKSHVPEAFIEIPQEAVQRIIN